MTTTSTCTHCGAPHPRRPIPPYLRAVTPPREETQARRRPRPKGTVPAALTDHNQQRATQAAQRTVERAAWRLRVGGLKPRQRAILQARVEHPGDSIGQLAERLTATLGRDVTKDAVAGVLRRTLADLP